MGQALAAGSEYAIPAEGPMYGVFLLFGMFVVVFVAPIALDLYMASALNKKWAELVSKFRSRKFSGEQCAEGAES